MISVIALCVAVPVGLFSAIYLSEYASLRNRTLIKPLMEILAGVPTVVYGFCRPYCRPLIRQTGLSIGLDVASNPLWPPGW